MKTKHSSFSLTLSLGLALALLWLVNGGLQPARADATPVHYVATTGSDSGDCSNSVSPCRTVQYAVDQAGAGDEVRVAAGVYSDVSARPRQDITTTGVVTQVVYLAKSVTVRGGYTTADWNASDPDVHLTTLDAGGKGRVIYITGDITPTVEGFIVIGGDATGYDGVGGGVLVWDADATISNCHIYSNTASAVIYGGGGGLYLHQSHATLSHNVVQSNTACVSGIGAGGGLYLDQSDAVLNGNTIAHNVAYRTAIPGQDYLGFGGGMYLDTSDAVLTGNTVQDNVADGGWWGGSQFGAGGGLYFYASSATLQGNTVISNVAGGLADGDGGGLYFTVSDGVVLNDNLVAGNTVHNGNGGGLYFRDSDDLVLQGNTFAGNSADVYGGGLYLRSGNVLSMTRNTVTDNVAQGLLGGGLYAREIHTATLSGNTFQGNLISYNGNGTGYGGGAYLKQSEAALHGEVVVGNVISATGSGYGGGLAFDESDVTMDGSTVQSNTITAGQSSSGGGVYQYKGRTVLSDNVIKDNVASVRSSGSGGGICMLDGDATLSGNLVQDNTASAGSGGSGGGVYVLGSATFLGNTIRGNVASAGGSGSGGGVYVYRKPVTMTGNIIVSNTATLSPTAAGRGGGLYLSWVRRHAGIVSLVNNFIGDNHANTEGSGIYAKCSTQVHLIYDTIAYNLGSGQGVYATGVLVPFNVTATLFFTDTIIAGHSSVGVTATTGTTMTMAATLWHDNGADTGGDGAFQIGAINRHGDPAFVDAAAWDYHITASSAALDAGVDAGVTTDIDGDARPQPSGYDIGADEWYTGQGERIYLPLVMRGQP